MPSALVRIGMALLAENVPERDRKGGVGVAGKADLLGTLDEVWLLLARDPDARQVALDVGGEHGDAGRREALRQDLQRHRLAGAGRAGNEAVAVGELQVDVFDAGVATADQDVAALRIEARIGGRVAVRPWLLVRHPHLRQRAGPPQRLEIPTFDSECTQ